MHYYVDGYNLLFHLKQAHNNLQSSREELIDTLCEKLSLVKIDVSIVFDAAYQIGISSRGHKHTLEIQYTSHGETADEYIIHELKVHRRKAETVITSDKKLAWLARGLGAKTLSVSEFIHWLNKAYEKKKRPKVPVDASTNKSESSKASEIITDEQRWQNIFEERSKYNFSRDEF